jgi:hypothetical protein
MTLPDSTTYPKPPGQERPYPKPTKTGRAPFKIPNHDLQGEAAYEVYGDLESGKVPLIALHGMPGPHTYLLRLSLVLTDYGVPVVMYDQIGCGESTHFLDRKGDTALWTPELFMVELDNLKQALGIQKFDLLGQSWGGMLAEQVSLMFILIYYSLARKLRGEELLGIRGCSSKERPSPAPQLPCSNQENPILIRRQYITTMQPTGLRKLIICDCLASMKLWMKSANKLRLTLPADIQEMLTRCEKEGKTDSPKYEAALDEFSKRHSCRLDPLSDELTSVF